jgi:hypothetical protein
VFSKIIGIIGLVALGLTAGVAGATEHEKKSATPDGTIEFSGGSVAVGVGFTWGSGTVKFKGKTYKVKVEGLSAGEVGGTSVKASGNIYNLQRIEDIEGTFTAGAAGGTLAGGGTRATMKNEKGVEMKIESKTKGLSLKFAAEGVKVKLEQ